MWLYRGQLLSTAMHCGMSQMHSDLPICNQLFAWLPPVIVT